ncbi:hypothetical protein QVD99_003346 [Batrachochytrium dendrobatidis]|nr:hypothetical protein O5D80_008633 [Batrachochytrium dendrobatidis]KAK5670160.1 hypothetical protein QVD99_003346 [Batrachochytrium dendrobatidis]
MEMERTVIEIDLWLRQPTKTNTILLESHLLSLVRPDRDVGANQSDLLIRKEEVGTHLLNSNIEGNP